MPKNRTDLDSLENYYENSVASAANLGAFSFAISSVNDITQMTNQGIETNDNLNEKRETVKEMNELPDAEDK